MQLFSIWCRSVDWINEKIIPASEIRTNLSKLFNNYSTSIGIVAQSNLTFLASNTKNLCGILCNRWGVETGEKDL